MAGGYGSLASAEMGSPSDLNLNAAQSSGLKDRTLAAASQRERID
jgi:hypothetical protein